MADRHIEQTLGVTFSRPWQPDWAPLWVWDGDDSRWESRGRGPDGLWVMDATPDHAPALGSTLEVWLREPEVEAKYVLELRPDQAQALRTMIDEWLEAMATTKGVR